jgi:hypothetical protein
MYHHPRHQSGSIVRSIAAIVVVIVMFLVISLSMTELDQNGIGPVPRPLPAGAALGGSWTVARTVGGFES